MPDDARTARASPHIVLVGLPGAGKSRCGALLAERLGRQFVDLDQVIEANAGLRITEIFARDGEPRFRELETQATRDLLPGPPLVIAPGGGWVERTENRDLVRGASRIVYLRVSPATALRRMGDDAAARPLLAGSDPRASIAALLARRAPYYEAADLVVDTEVLTPEQVVDALLELGLR